MIGYSKIFEMFRSYGRQTVATIAIMFAIMAPVLIGVAGMSLDYSQAYLVKQRLSQALDAAALAAAAAATEEGAINQKVQEFFAANYPEEKLGVTFDPQVQVIGDHIIVNGTARYDTMFLRVLNIDYIDVSAQTTVQREVQGLEVALVLDNTGSMSTNNNIQALKDGTINFINILFDSAAASEGTTDPEYIRIGMVPYSNTVNVGSYGLGKNPDGSVYGDGDVFVTLPSGVSEGSWNGCVVEHKSANYSSSATHVSNSYGQLWKNGASWNGHGWNPGSTSNDPYDSDTFDNYEGPWDIYAFGRLINQNDKCSNYSGYSNSRCSNCTGSYSACASTYCYCRNSSSNQGCPVAGIIPLSTDRDALLARVDDMNPDGNTLGNIGMAWGARVLSPEAPFEDAHDWDNQYWRKAIVMMTDGDNTENGTYSSYWFTAKNNMSVTKFNNRFAETCEALKDHGVTIYTVTFTSGINNATKDYYRNCATSEDHYFDAPSQDELKDAFERIARELSNLHISH